MKPERMGTMLGLAAAAHEEGTGDDMPTKTPESDPLKSPKMTAMHELVGALGLKHEGMDTEAAATSLHAFIEACHEEKASRE